MLDVLQVLETEILEIEIELVPDLLVDRFGNADASRVREGLEARGDVHAVAIDPVVLDDHVPEVDADPGLDAFLGAPPRVLRCLLLLDAAGAAHGVHHAVELTQDRVAGRVDHPTLELLDEELHLPVKLLDLIDGRVLVGPHHPTEAADVRHHDGRELATAPGLPLSPGARR